MALGRVQEYHNTIVSSARSKKADNALVSIPSIFVEALKSPMTKEGCSLLEILTTTEHSCLPHKSVAHSN